MSEPERVVVIGDPKKERFEWLAKLLSDEYAVKAVQAETFGDVKKYAPVKQNPGDEIRTEYDVRIVFLTDDLPPSPHTPEHNPNSNFSKLEEHFFAPDFVCIITKADNPVWDDFRRCPHEIHLRSFPPTDKERDEIKIELRSLGRLRPVIGTAKVANITEWDRNNRNLRRQIRSLSEKHDLDDGTDVLINLIAKCIDCNGVTKIEVKQLGQGRSGATVFRLISHAAEIKEYVLKLSRTEGLRKLQAEVRGHLKAQEDTGLPGYKQHVAMLREPHYLKERAGANKAAPDRISLFIVNSGQWHAIHYDFLGSSAFGKFIDLQTALTAMPLALMEKTEDTKFTLASTDPSEVLDHRAKIFNTTLDGLCEIWYRKKGFSKRILETVWKIEDADDLEFHSLPPYQLTRRVKDWVQDFLDSHEAVIGTRLFPNHWAKYRDHVLKLVSDESTSADLGRLGGKTLFTLSPVHGDLNANNVLLWLEQEMYPFVIDLPFYQKAGHTLQDFARLEVEIKFALMDRQEESSENELAAYDYTNSQVPLWIELEDLLLSDQALDGFNLRSSALLEYDWKESGFKDNVTLCHKLIMLVREKACEIQQKVLKDEPDAGPFAAEYLPALLYHTIRSIGYPSLSVFKRLLAVYSSGLILERLEQIMNDV